MLKRAWLGPASAAATRESPKYRREVVFIGLSVCTSTMRFSFHGGLVCFEFRAKWKPLFSIVNGSALPGIGSSSPSGFSAVGPALCRSQSNNHTQRWYCAAVARLDWTLVHSSSPCAKLLYQLHCRCNLTVYILLKKRIRLQGLRRMASPRLAGSGLFPNIQAHDRKILSSTYLPCVIYALNSDLLAVVILLFVRSCSEAQSFPFRQPRSFDPSCHISSGVLFWLLKSFISP